MKYLTKRGGGGYESNQQWTQNTVNFASENKLEELKFNDKKAENSRSKAFKSCANACDNSRNLRKLKEKFKNAQITYNENANLKNCANSLGGFMQKTKSLVNKKQIVALFMLAVLFAVCACVGVFCVVGSCPKNTNVNTATADGTAYTISTEADLVALATTTDYDTYYASGVTINCAVSSVSNWSTPIGTEAHPFKGTFEFLYDIHFNGTSKPLFGYLDGATIDSDGGHTLTSGSFSDSGEYVGAVAYVAKDTTIKNLRVDNTAVTGAKYTGGIFGACYGTTNITNVTIRGSMVTGNPYVGGLVGISYGTLTIEDSGLGSNCAVRGITTLESTASEYGIIGCVDTNSTITASNLVANSSGLTQIATETSNTITITSLAEFADNVNNGVTYEGITVKLGANIRVTATSAQPSAIGTSEHPFKGTFDRNGYSIMRTIAVDYGLFGYIEGATIKSLTMMSSDITATTKYAGCVADVAINCTFNDISLNANITGTEFAGIVVGYSRNNTFSTFTTSYGCSATGYYAGFVGYASGTYSVSTIVASSLTFNYGGTACNEYGIGFKESACAVSGEALTGYTTTATTITGYSSPSVTIDMDGGMCDASTVLSKDSATTCTLPTIAKSGYAQVGFTLLSGGGSVSGTTFTYGSSSAVVKALWTLETYTITYDLNGGSLSGQVTTYNVNTASFTLLVPTKARYEFVGWTGSNGAIPQTAVTVATGSTGNLSYTANWVEATVDVTISVTANTKRQYLIYILELDGSVCQTLVVSNGSTVSVTVGKNEGFKLLIYDTLYMTSQINGVTARSVVYEEVPEGLNISIQLAGANDVNNWVFL